MCDPFGWHNIDGALLLFIWEKSASFESMVWSEILIVGKKFNHHVSTNDLCKEAKNRLEDLHLDDLEELLSLRLQGSGRVWGYVVNGIVTLLWWDPEHKVCPYLLKNT